MSESYCPECQTRLSHRIARLPLVRGRHLECAVGWWLNDQVQKHGVVGFPLMAVGALFVLSLYVSLGLWLCGVGT